MSERKTHWERVYHDKSPLEVSWYQKESALSLRLIRNAQLAIDAPIIDVGGGASVLVDALINDRYSNVAVLDISAKALTCTKDRLGDKANSVEWYVEDITQFKSPRQFSLWHDRAVFHFLTDKLDRNNYVSILKRALEPNGNLIMAAFAIGGPTKCSGFDIVQYDAEKLMAELGEGFELVEENNETHITPANKEQKFTYFHFIAQSRSSATPNVGRAC